MTREEAEQIMQSDMYKDSGKVAVYAYQDGDDYVVEKDGKEYRSTNVFGLDSQLDSVFGPRNLFLVPKEESDNA